MAVSIEKIKELRDATGVSMTACKSALEQANGDFEEAVAILRKKGEAKAADRSARATGQGVVVIKSEGSKYVMVQLLCETDFVARGDDFMKLADSIAEKLLMGVIKPTDKDLPEVKDAVLRLGENVQLGEMAVYENKNVGEYVHSNKKIGVLVSLTGGDSEVARDIAMHIAATSPAVISPDEVSEDLIAKEREIWAEQLKKDNKPAEIIEKIMQGKERKFREENALLKQIFVKDSEKTIEDLLKKFDATVERFSRFAI